MKYLRFHNDELGLDEFVLFSNSLVHAQMAEAVAPLLEPRGYALLSAGTATGAHIDASGGSESLGGLPSLPDDRQRLNVHEYGPADPLDERIESRIFVKHSDLMMAICNG